MSSTDDPNLLKDPLAASLAYQLRRASISVMLAITDAYARHGLKMTDAVLLKFIEINPGCNQGRIGKTLGVKQNNLVKIVNGLVAKDIVDRQQADGRTYSLFLTPEGRKLAAIIDDIDAAVEQRFFDSYSAQERHFLMDAFVKTRKIALSDSPIGDKGSFSHLDGACTP